MFNNNKHEMNRSICNLNLKRVLHNITLFEFEVTTRVDDDVW